MYRHLSEILLAYRVTEFVHRYHAYDSGQTIGLIDRFDNTAVWFRLHPSSFWYFDGRTPIEFLHQQTKRRDIWGCWWYRADQVAHFD